jgi:hypothetical protein
VPGAEQRQAVHLGKNQVRRHELRPPFDRGAERTICRCVMLVAPAAQRDPRATIDEQSSGGGRGTGRTARQ